jgi:hypothetical protein
MWGRNHHSRACGEDERLVGALLKFVNPFCTAVAPFSTYLLSPRGKKRFDQGDEP